MSDAKPNTLSNQQYFTCIPANMLFFNWIAMYGKHT